MTAAFILGINMFVAAVFAVAFGAIAATTPGSRGAQWLSLGYAVGIVNVLLEFLLPMQSDPLAVSVAIFLVFLLALCLCTVGVARHYGVEPPWRAMAVVAGLSTVAVPLIFTMPYRSPLRNLLYQLPYFFLHLLALGAVIRSQRRQILDLLLIGALALAGLIYLSKPVIATIVGAGSTPQRYIETEYAAISQSLGSGTLVAVALILLLVIMRDTTAEILARSETDSLSGILNRRGFTKHATLALDRAQQSAMPVVLIAADLDHFKAINDHFGHAAGDAAIARFADILSASIPSDAIVSRTGGEEFTILIVGADLGAGRRIADEARRRYCSANLSSVGIVRSLSASFGVAQRMPGEGLFDLWHRADAALYRAKDGGRDQVRVALNELPMSSKTDAA